MFAKLALVILAGCGTACGLLALRQSRLVVAHELAAIQLRVRDMDERLLAVRADIGRLVTPERVGTMVAGKAELKPLIMKPEGEGKPAAPSVLDREMYVQRDAKTLPARDRKKDSTGPESPR